jgi:membrane-associated protein
LDLQHVLDFIRLAIDSILHIDVVLAQLVQTLGPSLYGLLFVIVFCETGLIVLPFLPGDSLLFAVGALAALPDSPLDLRLLAVTMITAALLGDLTNYTVGAKLGERLFTSEKSRLFNRKHLVRTHEFYARYGGKTIILARFVPIVRTFAPFVAGVGKMAFPRYMAYCVTGAVLWVVPFLVGGYLLGNQPAIKTNFHIVIVVIIAISVAPAAIEVLRARRKTAATGPAV